MEVAAAFLAWLGVSVVVVSDGRWGLALGTAIATVGLAALAFPSSGILGTSALAIGGVASAGRRATTGPPGWGIMPAGSTPRVVLCVAVALAALWTALSLTFGGDAALRFAVFAVVGLAVARVLSNDQVPGVLSAVALMPLAVAAATGFGVQAGGLVYIAAAAIAAAVPWLPLRKPVAA